MSTQKGTLINKYTPDYVIFDLETTGISPNYDEVIEISALRVKGGEVVDEFNTLVNPGRKIPFGATKVNGITNAMVAEAPAFSHVLAEFLDFAEGLVLVGHNIARFDMKFIWRDAEQYFGEIPQNNYVDTLQVARKHLPKMDHHRLVDLAEYYGISSEGAHRALNDCYMNQKVYECMVSEMREAQKKRLEEARKKAAETANAGTSANADQMAVNSLNNLAHSNRNQTQNENAQSEGVEVQQRPQHFTVKIRGVVERITYQNPENGYTVLKCAVKSYKELVTVIGSLLDVNVGSVLLIYGNWKVDSRYGRQFAAESWEETLPATVFGIEKYLGSGLIKGVGPKYAKKIVAQFGTETLEVIETDISRLQEVDGIGKKRIKMIRDSWERQKEIKNVMLFLQDHGVSTSFAAKIYRQYGNESLEKMKENPFQMADDIWGIGFKTADGIAQKLGFAKEAYVRLRSGIMYTLSNLADEGHVFAYQEQLIAKAAELLEAEESSIVMTLDQMIADKDLICETMDYNTDQTEMQAIYLPAFYYAEAGVAGKLKRLAQSPATDRLWHALMDARQKTGNESLSIDVGKIQEKVHMEYDEIQADAIRKAAVSKVMVLTGGPGTGKTTTTQGIITAYRAFGLKILLAAPTGRATKRMTEATGLEAKTIHRLLECKPPEGYQKNENNPLEGDVLIIDECSMIDMILMNALLKAIPEGMRLILVGDIDQLPSVGAGNVLRDIIDSGVFPVVRLTRIFRQAQSSRIIMNAHAINEGKFPDISNGKNTDFFYIEKEDPEEAVQEIVRLVKNNLPRYYKTPWNHIQVLTPMQKGIVGAANLNLALQEALNPQGDGLRRGGYLFRAGDKVMQIRNNYEKEIFNGDIGTVESVDLQERMLKVNFDQHIIEYEASELDELVHAYATTIHKAQGSEYPAVVIPLLGGPRMLMTRNLLYTAVTRARKCVTIVGSDVTFQAMIGNHIEANRYTTLARRIREMQEENA